MNVKKDPLADLIGGPPRLSTRSGKVYKGI